MGRRKRAWTALEKEDTMPKFTIIVLDSVGVGALPDAAEFGDVGTNTLKHVNEHMGGLDIPNMKRLGLFHIDGTGLPAEGSAKGCYGKAAEVSKAKDTTNGHFEIAGLKVKKPFKVFGESFPDRIINELEKQIGTKVIGNFPASGTEIIKELGEEHVRTGYPIVYLSADSLMQIAMHESVIPLEKQYEICMKARKILSGDDTVSRVICRPFTGTTGNYYRTENRKDFSVDPPGTTVLDLLCEKGKDVIGVGKIEDIFNRRGLTKINHTKNNKEGIKATLEYLNEGFNGLLFVNLVDFDMLYGHRNNPQGYGEALQYFDKFIPEMISLMEEEDILLITADHGCDPTMPGTDHTREYIPILVYGKKLNEGVNLGTRTSFSDIAATVAEYFGYTFPEGTSFLKEISAEE